MRSGVCVCVGGGGGGGGVAMSHPLPLLFNANRTLACEEPILFLILAFPLPILLVFDVVSIRSSSILATLS